MIGSLLYAEYQEYPEENYVGVYNHRVTSMTHMHSEFMGSQRNFDPLQYPHAYDTFYLCLRPRKE